MPADCNEPIDSGTKDQEKGSERARREAAPSDATGAVIAMIETNDHGWHDGL
jgi:hypothetical protein